MILLIKIPSRERKAKLLDVLRIYNQKIQWKQAVHYLFSFDLDDDYPTKEELQAIVPDSQVTISVGKSGGKIDAINRGINLIEHWDILLLGSDDFIPIVDDFDEVIRNHFRVLNPDLTKALWTSDGHQDRINTLPIMGRRCYESKGYIYHPSYISLWCDNEYTEVLTQEGRLIKIDDCILQHESPVWKKKVRTLPIIKDHLFIKNESYNEKDKANYEARKEAGFKD